MRFTLVLLALLLMSSASGQECAKKFMYAAPYAMFAGGGFEFGTWPGENARMGYAAGFNTVKQSYTNKQGQTSSIIDAAIYGKVFYRFHRFIYGTASLGMYDLTEPGATIGLKFMIPVVTGKSAVFVEPYWGTRGSNIKIAFALPLK